MDETVPQSLTETSVNLDSTPIHSPMVSFGDVSAGDTGSSSSPLDHLIPGTKQGRLRQIWAVGGGKGGVGKSLIASGMSIALARTGAKVIAIDLDLGGANLHTTLGVDLPKQTLGDFLSHRVSDLNACVVPTTIPNLSIISGAQDSVGVSNLKVSQQTELLKQIRQLDADYIVFDLGAGTHFSTIHFFLHSQVGIITLLPEPTSIENSYRFIKSAYYHYLYRSPSLSDIRPLIELAMDPKNPLGIRSPADLFSEVNKTNPEYGNRLKQQIEHFRPHLVINQTRTQTDVEIGYSIKTVCKKYFGFELDYAGFLDYDSSVWQAVRRKRPLMMEFPNSKVVSGIEHITANLVKLHGAQITVPPHLR